MRKVWRKYKSAPSPARVSGASVQIPNSNPDPATALAALGNPWRLAMVRWLADGRRMTATDFATAFQRDFDGLSKHLRVLRAAGLLACQCGEEDARCACFYIPESFRPEPGVVDYGFCLLRFPKKEEPAPVTEATDKPAPN